MSEAVSIPSEFEKIFGAPVVRQTLFAPDDEEYYKLRQYIIDHPKLEYDREVLPFCGISISQSHYKLSQQTVEKIEPVVPLTIIEPVKPTVTLKKTVTPKQHLFYIKRQVVEGVSCDATGYYDVLKDKFILQKGSRCAKDLPSNKFRTGDYERRNFLRNKCRYDADGYYLLENVECVNPGLAALYVTGFIPRNGWIVWHDADGASLKEIYKK